MLPFRATANVKAALLGRRCDLKAPSPLRTTRDVPPVREFRLYAHITFDFGNMVYALNFRSRFMVGAKSPTPGVYHAPLGSGWLIELRFEKEVITSHANTTGTVSLRTLRVSSLSIRLRFSRLPARSSTRRSFIPAVGVRDLSPRTFLRLFPHRRFPSANNRSTPTAFSLFREW